MEANGLDEHSMAGLHLSAFQYCDPPALEASLYRETSEGSATQLDGCDTQPRRLFLLHTNDRRNPDLKVKNCAVIPIPHFFQKVPFCKEDGGKERTAAMPRCAIRPVILEP